MSDSSNTTIPEFGIKRENEERRDGGCAVIFDPETGQFAVGRRRSNGCMILFGGGVDAGEDMQAGVMREVCEEGGLHDFARIERLAEAFAHYHHTGKNLNRVAYAACFLAVLASRDVLPVALEAHEDFDLVWTDASEIRENWQEQNKTNEGGYDHWIYFLDKSLVRLAELGYDVR